MWKKILAWYCSFLTFLGIWISDLFSFNLKPFILKRWSWTISSCRYCGQMILCPRISTLGCESKSFEEILRSRLKSWHMYNWPLNNFRVMSVNSNTVYNSGMILQLAFCICGSTSSYSAAAAKSLQSCPTLCDSIDVWQSTRLPHPWDSPGKNTGVGCHFLLQCMKVKSEKWNWSRSVVSDSQRPHGLQPNRLLHPWDFPGKSTGVGCHCLLRDLSWAKVKM